MRNGKNLALGTTSARWFQMFKFKGAYLVNERGRVVDISNGQDEEGQNIITWKQHNGLNQ